MKTKHYLVVDIGKTNKKLIVYDEALQAVETVRRRIDGFTKDGVDYEDTDGLIAFLREGIRELAGRFQIAGIAATTHGATFACLDGSGRISVPMLSYTTDPGPSFQSEFVRAHGGLHRLKERTATHDLSLLLNVAKGVAFARARFPEAFARTRHILFMPQYVTYLLTGAYVADATYAGCHGYLYDPHGKRWSYVAEQLGILDLLPAGTDNSWHRAGTVAGSPLGDLGLDPDCPVACGIHDSNASFLPYLIKGADRFVLNSTGTWCVAMRRAPDYRFAEADFERTVFFNTDAYGQPVKTAIFMGGFEFEQYLSLLNRRTPGFTMPAFDEAAMAAITQAGRDFALPSVNREIGLFPGSAGQVVLGEATYPFADLAKAPERLPAGTDAHVGRLVQLSLAIQSAFSFSILGLEAGVDVFVEGGFSANDSYCRLLSALLPGNRVLLTGLQEATAFGTALLARACADGVTPDALAGLFRIETREVPKVVVPGLPAYQKAFLARLAKAGKKKVGKK